LFSAASSVIAAMNSGGMFWAAQVTDESGEVKVWVMIGSPVVGVEFAVAHWFD
jgi:hypothetical protein